MTRALARIEARSDATPKSGAAEGESRISSKSNRRGPMPIIEHKGGRASFSQSRNDMHWQLYAGEDGFIRWSGYDDRNWWENVSHTDRTRIGKVTGRTFRLDHKSCEVEILP